MSFGRLARRESGSGFGGQLLVPDTPGLDHALLAVCDRDEGAQLDDLFLAEVDAQPCP
ncbi:MAG TPA: hypothetical protein VFA00_04580 [Actinomycetota bacterium]|nr:hypothetical protein [Actinomycetota bacterium]